MELIVRTVAMAVLIPLVIVECKLIKKVWKQLKKKNNGVNGK